MSPRLRTILRVIHRWVGFPFGVFLFILCFTGSLACFGPEVQNWMQPEAALRPSSPPMSQTGLIEASHQLKAQLDKGQFAFLKLPSQRDPVFRLWHYDGHIFRGPALAADTGLPLLTSDVVGGSFFTTLHSSLYLPTPWGQCLTALAGLALMIALISGLWLQLRRFLPDLLLFRPHAARHRQWLDLHLLGGTLSIPILFIVGGSGLVLQSQKLLHFINPPSHTARPANRHQAHSQTSPPISDALITKLAQNAQQQWGDEGNGFFMLAGKELALYAPDTLHFCLYRQAITASRPRLPPHNLCPTLHSVFLGVHNLRWAGFVTRCLYGLTGLLGCLIIGSGMRLFLQSEQNHLCHHHAITYSQHIRQRLYRAVSMATIFGLPLATLALCWSTRLPAPLPPILWEEGLFFTLWGVSLLYALISRHAARHLLMMLMLLGLGTSGLDLATRPFHTGRPALFLSVDALAACLGGACLLALLYHPHYAKKRAILRSKR
ncbi:PepSY-associated TM helix domain-containing protein [Bombella saccharophila]|uniref:PepSY domain-containing protein n=1 Tax=Bombella saccharophila TaxID=2967338 RepID=A0ABT3W830_9PROT|nr:PepSY-associated TM helix domain-containing protein [Bombella saccharophila]MCX5613937.1 PepSY domain-containing protein [Bombella saccharophila]